jgi:hypothetical protein
MADGKPVGRVKITVGDGGRFAYDIE